MPLGLVDPLAAGVPVDVALVGGDAQVGHAAPRCEMIHGHIGAEAADHFRAIQSEAHDRLLWFLVLTMVAERVRALSTPSPLTLLQALLQLWPAVRLAVCRIAADLTTVRAVNSVAVCGTPASDVRSAASGSKRRVARDRTGGARSARRGSGVGRGLGPAIAEGPPPATAGVLAAGVGAGAPFDGLCGPATLSGSGRGISPWRR